MSVYNDEQFDQFIDWMKTTEDSAKLASLLHEMKRHTPIIKGYAELLKRGIATDSPKDLLLYVEGIIEANNDLIKLWDAFAAINRA